MFVKMGSAQGTDLSKGETQGSSKSAEWLQENIKLLLGAFILSINEVTVVKQNVISAQQLPDPDFSLWICGMFMAYFMYCILAFSSQSS